MKIRFFALFLTAVLLVAALSGCQTTAAGAQAPGNSAPVSAEKPTTAMATTSPTAATAAENAPTTAAISPEEAQKIALDHAGFTADQVTRLHTEYDVDHGVPHYDVEFDEGRFEYDYEIHAETGEILQFEKDD